MTSRLETRHWYRLAPPVSPRPDRLAGVARAGRGRVMTVPFGFSFLSSNYLVAS